LAAGRLLDPSFPLQATAVASRGFAESVRRTIEGGKYDLIHVEHLRALQFVPQAMHHLVVFDAVDCVSDLFEKAAGYQPAWKRWIFKLEASRLARYEASALSSVAQAVVSSRRDAVALWGKGAARAVAVIPNPVNLERLTPGEHRSANDVVFTGKMSFHANAVAASWLIDDIWPRIRRLSPESRLTIAGAAPSRSLRRRAGDGVYITGYVEDLGTLISNAAVAVAPLRYAVGIQNKVLEALACGTPLVATPAAIGDLALSNGENVLVASNAAEFASCVAELLNRPEWARQLGRAGREWVVSNNSSAGILELWSAAYRSVLVGQPATDPSDGGRSRTQERAPRIWGSKAP